MNTRHSMDEAKRIQKAFEERYASETSVVGVGISLNQRADDLAINVFVTSEGGKQKIPAAFEGLDVVVELVDGFKAQ